MATRAAPSPPSFDTLWEVVQKVAASASFQRSPRLRELLLYICERAIQNRPDELREQSIGRGVFGRKADYNPAEDNIVRVEMRQLRKRLEEYFATEGKDEPYVVAIPKGAYLPVLELREPAPVAVVPRLAPAPAKASPRTRFRWAAGAIIILLAGMCLWLAIENRKMLRRLEAVPAPKIERAALWPLLFNNAQETLIVCADSTLVVAETVLHRSVTLAEYQAHDYTSTLSTSDAAKAVLRSLPHWLFTDMTDVRLSHRLFWLNADHWDKVSIRSARTTQVQDFKQANVILLGSVRSNPWDSLFEPALKFRFQYDEQAHAAYIRNQQPRPGEQAVYRAASPGQSGDSYSVIAMVPNLRKTGYVLMIGGTTGEGTEAAGEFIMNPATSSSLINRLTAKNKGRIPYFEVLLKSGTLAGVAKNAEIVAERIVPD
jgi:hypothetical protein